MKVCFPVAKNDGIQSVVFDHFGSAPIFLLVDSDSREIAEEVNRDLHHAHGQCSPLKALGGMAVDAVVVGGIGGGALRGLAQAGVRVFRAEKGTVAENLDKFAQGALGLWGANDVCGGHGHTHGHGHDCGHHG